MTYAIITSEGTVINTVIWDGQSTWQGPSGYQVIEMQNGAGIGWSYVNGEFTPPPEPEPEPELN